MCREEHDLETDIKGHILSKMGRIVPYVFISLLFKRTDALSVVYLLFLILSKHV